MLEKIRRDAFSAQLHAMKKELEELKSKSVLIFIIIFSAFFSTQAIKF